MNNSAQQENKDIPEDTSSQYPSPEELGDLPTPEELAEWAADCDFEDSESDGFLVVSKTSVPMQLETQSQELPDRKSMESRLLSMGFPQEEISSMSDDELKETIEVNLNQEPEYVSGEEIDNEKRDNAVDAEDNDFHLEDCVIDGPPVCSFGASPNNKASAKEESNTASNDKENQEEQETLPEIKEIPQGKDISAVFASVPSGIIECQLPDTGVIPLEMQAERTSVIVFPNKASAQAAKHTYPKYGLIDFSTDNNLKNHKDQIRQGARMLAAPETIKELSNSLDSSKIDFFLIISDMDTLQGEASYRDAVSTMYDAYARHPKDRRCIITTDSGAFSDPAMAKEKKYILKGGAVSKRKPEIISSRNIILALKKAIEGIRRPKKIEIFYNSVQQSRLAILNLKEQYRKECGILCNEASKEEAGEFYIDTSPEQEQMEKRITFHTSLNDIPASDKPFVLITVSDATRGNTTLPIRQIIRIQDAAGNNAMLSRDIIIHNTSKCYTEDWQSSFSAFIKQGNRISGLLNATEELAKDDKALARFFRPIRRIVQYKVGIKGRFQQIKLLRQDSLKEWKPSYMAIDSLLVRTRLLENLYSTPYRLSEALKAYYPDLKHAIFEEEQEQLVEEQKGIEKSERKKSLERAADSRNRELDRIFGLEMNGELDTKTIEREVLRGRSSKRKIWREFQRIYPYIDTEEAIQHLKRIKAGNRIGFKNLNNSIMFWALDDEHPLKQSVYSLFKAGESYTSKEIKEKMSPIVKYHFNRDIMAEETDTKEQEQTSDATDNAVESHGLTLTNQEQPDKRKGRQAQGRKLITLFKSFMNAERPRDRYITAKETPYHTHGIRITKDDNDMMQYFIL